MRGELTERQVSIAWFADLTNLLGKYLAVLRYELGHEGDQQTVEALIHAEITKILVRLFTPDCVVTEYAIGDHFVNGKRDDESEFTRQFRADIAIFHPVVNRKIPGSLPMAVIELKRDGSKKALLDDVYRLAIVSLKTKATGYFVFAGPTEHVKTTMKGVPLLIRLEKDNTKTHKISFNSLKDKCSLYARQDHV